MLLKAATDIGVRPGKPDLLENLVACLAFRGLDPQGRPEVDALLVERECMQTILDVGSEAGVVELIKFSKDTVHVSRNAERSDRIPDTDALDGCPGMAVGKFRPHIAMSAPLAAQAIALPQNAEAIHVALSQDPGIADQTADASHGIGAARPSKHEELVAWTVVV